jgi:hypothetical protein
MRVEIVESLPVRDEAALPCVDDAGWELALRAFSAAIASDDSLFTCEVRAARPTGASGVSVCAGDFVLWFRSANLGSNRRLHFSLIKKLVELLNEAGSADSLAIRICLISEGAVETRPAGFALRLRLEARGNLSEQAGLRWGLGVARVQQALLFTSRYLRQQIAQRADEM